MWVTSSLFLLKTVIINSLGKNRANKHLLCAFYYNYYTLQCILPHLPVMYCYKDNKKLVQTVMVWYIFCIILTPFKYTFFLYKTNRYLRFFTCSSLTNNFKMQPFAARAVVDVWILRQERQLAVAPLIDSEFPNGSFRQTLAGFAVILLAVRIAFYAYPCPCNRIILCVACCTITILNRRNCGS